MKTTLLLLATFIQLALCPLRAGAQAPAFADGKTDATAPIQKMLDAQGLTGGELSLPPGQYLLNGTLTVPPGVTLRGSTFDQSCPAAILKPGVTAAIITGNLQPGGVQIDNQIGSRAVAGLNQEK